MNKAEYDNTIRDSVGLDLKLADGFPTDGVCNSFDNVGDAFSIPPALLEKYFTTAESIAERVFDRLEKKPEHPWQQDRDPDHRRADRTDQNRAAGDVERVAKLIVVLSIDRTRK